MDLSSTLGDILTEFVVVDSVHPLEEALLSTDQTGINLLWPDTSRVHLDISCMSIISGAVVMATPPPIHIPGGENPSNPQESEPVTPPVLESLSPDNIAAGGTGFTLTLAGTGFTPSCNVRFGEAVGNLEYESPTSGSFDVGPEGYAAPGEVQVSVSGSNELPFTITA